MKNEKFERLLSEIRNEQVDDKMVAQAGERVYKSIAGAAPAMDLSAHTLRNCEDFQALIPGYLGKQLAPARILLFEDHVHACVACRHALEHARDGEKCRRYGVWSPSVPVRWHGAGRWAPLRFSPRQLRWSRSATGCFPASMSSARQCRPWMDRSIPASGAEMRLIPAGYEIRNGDEVRTAKGSTAVVRLLDGSLVEMGERSDLSVSRGWKGTTIRLDGGKVIVQAAKQKSGRLYVATDDGLVSVKGTIFSVNHGTKGSRVAVIEGVVRVNFGENTTDLTAGEQATSGASVSKVPIQNEIAWSKNSAKYLALLGDFAVLQKQFAAIPGPGLRYSSELLPYVPDNTVVYAAIPNLANTLGEATRLFQDRLQQSPALRDWWKQQQKGNGPKLEDVLNQVRTFNTYLGDEIVFAVAKNGTDYAAPVVLAKVKQGGLETFLRTQAALQTVPNPWGATPAANKAAGLCQQRSDDRESGPGGAAAYGTARKARQRQHFRWNAVLPADCAFLPTRGGMDFLRRHGTNCREERTS